MKIAMIGQKGMPAHYGGVERIVEQLSIRLAKIGHDVVVYTRPHYTPKIKTHHEGVRLINLPSIHTKHLDAISHTFLCTVHAVFQKYDIIHYHGVGPALVAWIPRIFFPRTKVIIDFQCRDSLHQKWGKFARFMLATGERAALIFAHVTTVPTQTLQQYCEETYKRKPVVVPNGMFIPDLKSAFLIRKEFGLETNGYILAVSRLVRHKGLHYLIEAYKKIQTNKKLVIVGDSAFTDDYVKELEELASGNDNIIFTGWQSGQMLEELYSNAYVFIQPSETEGLALSILEAAAYNNCVLTSDIPENKELASRCGFTFQNKNVADLAQKLEYLLAHDTLVEIAGKNARKLIEKKYLWDDITKQMHYVYHDALKHSHSAA